MDLRRVFLYSALAFVIFSLWTNWQADYPAAPVRQQSSLSANAGSDTLLPTKVLTSSDTTEQGMPSSAVASSEPAAGIPLKKSAKSPVVHVETDVLKLDISLKHGDIIRASLSDYPVSVDKKDTPFELLQDNPDERYVANSDLFIVKGQVIENADGHYTSSSQDYQLNAGQEELVVTLSGQNKEGLLIQKDFIFKKGSYLIAVRYHLTNNSSEVFKGYMNTQLLRNSPTEDKSSIFHVGSYTGASYSIPGKHRYQKVNFKDMTKTNLDVLADSGWIAMQQHYFLTAWIPEKESKNQFYTRAVGGDFTIGTVSQPLTLLPAQKASVGSNLYLGPEITSDLKAIAPGLDLTVDYGWLWFLSSLLFTLMKAIYSVVGNWGWVIVLVTVLIKLAFYRLSATSYKSMAGMRKLQPKLQALRDRYGDDKTKISQATMELYRQEKVNPLGGCLPIVIQIPVFIALYWVLLESVELRQAPFILWIKDLAMPDPMHILPVIMGATMLIQQKLNPAPPDPMQAKIMMFLPVLFTGLFWNFPAGLVLYWIVNNSLSILQQWYITRKYSDDKPKRRLAVAK